MNRIHTITVPYSVMKACPMSWVQRVHIHKGSTKFHILIIIKMFRLAGAGTYQRIIMLLA